MLTEVSEVQTTGLALATSPGPMRLRQRAALSLIEDGASSVELSLRALCETQSRKKVWSRPKELMIASQKEQSGASNGVTNDQHGPAP